MPIMQRELALSKERQRNLKQEHEARMRQKGSMLNLERMRLAEATAVVKAGADSCGDTQDILQELDSMHLRIAQATARRDDLARQWQQIRQANSNYECAVREGSVPHTDIQHVHGQLEQDKPERGILQAGTDIHQELRNIVQRLYEELDELKVQREDERVRSESEVRELKAQRDKHSDTLDEAIADLQLVKVRIETMFSLRGEVDIVRRELNSLKLENESRASELTRLLKVEDDRKQVISKLEREQEAMVESMTVMTSQAIPKTEGYAGTANHVRAFDLNLQDSQQQQAHYHQQ